MLFLRKCIYDYRDIMQKVVEADTRDKVYKVVIKSEQENISSQPSNTCGKNCGAQ